MNKYLLSATNADRIISAIRVVENGLSIMDKSKFQVNTLDGEIVIWLEDEQQDAVFAALLNRLGIEHFVIVDNRTGR